jgi:sugar phosphate isomerase/epimerase
MKIGVQTFTIRRLVRKKLSVSLTLLKRRDVHAIELARMPLSDMTVAMLNQHQLEVLSLQLTYQKLKRKFKQVVDFCKMTACSRVCVSVLPISAILGGEQAILKFSKKLNHLQARYEKEHIELGFHHHDFEFKNVGRSTKFDLIFKHTDPKVKFVIDTFWATKSHINLVDLIQKVGPRLMGIHLRDFKIDSKTKEVTDVELGRGEIDFVKVIQFGKTFADYMVIEQDTKHPMQSIDTSMKYLKIHFAHLFETKGETYGF